MKTLSLQSFLWVLIKKFITTGELDHGVLFHFSSGQNPNLHAYLLALRHNTSLVVLESLFEEGILIDTSNIGMKVSILTDGESNLKTLLNEVAFFADSYPLDLLSFDDVICVTDQFESTENGKVNVELHQKIVEIKSFIN